MALSKEEGRDGWRRAILRSLSLLVMRETFPRSPEDTPFTSYQMEFAEVALQERGIRQGEAGKVSIFNFCRRK